VLTLSKVKPGMQQILKPLQEKWEELLHNPTLPQWNQRVGGVIRYALGILANLRLRTKFLLSMILVIAGLTWVALLIVRQTVQERARQELTTDANNSLVIFEILQHQRRMVMSRKADLLATSAFLSNNDANTFRDSIDNPLDTSRSDLEVLADPSGKIVALYPTHTGFSTQNLEALLRFSLARNRSSDWWFEDGRLYQVELQPIGPAGAAKRPQSGTVVVGQELDERGVRDLGRLLSSEVAFRYRGRTVASTLDPLQERELSSQLQGRITPDQMHLGSERFFVSSVELTPDLPDGASLMVLRSDSETMAFLHRLNLLLLRVGFLAVLVGGFLAFLISKTFTKPLGRLMQGVHALEHGDFNYQLELQGGGEVAEVTLAFDRMRHTLQRNGTERQQLEEQLRQSQKMEALGRLAGGVAHDFNNLLTIIKGHSDLLLDWLSTSEASYKSCEQINKAADRASSLTRQLLVFSRRQVLKPKVLDLNALVTEMDKLLGRLIREDVEFVFVPGAVLGSVKADPGQIEQVLLNLTVNACDAMPKGGKLTIETRNVMADKEYTQSRPGLQQGPFVLLSATDTGHGMDAKTKARIFEPFFTTKDIDKGTGLGLATVYGIVKQSGGFIWVESTPGKGSRFEVYLPKVAEKHDLLASAETLALPAVPGAATIMVVEDDIAVRELACRFLDTAGYHVLAAKDGVEALQIAKHRGQSIGALLTDVVMPKMRGTELAVRLSKLLPKIKVIFMSGYLEHNDESDELVEDSVFLEKPFTRESLLSKVNEVFRSASVVNPKRYVVSGKPRLGWAGRG
jgi:signal transduction histidine kinase/CheY-like chemotaxis protein